MPCEEARQTVKVTERSPTIEGQLRQRTSYQQAWRMWIIFQNIFRWRRFSHYASRCLGVLVQPVFFCIPALRKHFAEENISLVELESIVTKDKLLLLILFNQFSFTHFSLSLQQTHPWWIYTYLHFLFNL